MTFRALSLLHLVRAWAVWVTAPALAVSGAVFVWHYSSGWAVAIGASALLLAAVLDPVRTIVITAFRDRRSTVAISPSDARAGRRVFLRLWVTRRTVLRGAGLSITVRASNSNDEPRSRIPRLRANYTPTVRGFTVDLSPLVRNGQTVTHIEQAATRLSANVGVEVTVTPAPADPFSTAQLEFRLRPAPDYLSQVRPADSSFDWLWSDDE